MVRDIFTDAQTSLRRPANLKTLVTEIDKLDWFSARREGLGDLACRQSRGRYKSSQPGTQLTLEECPSSRIEGPLPPPRQTVWVAQKNYHGYQKMLHIALWLI